MSESIRASLVSSPRHADFVHDPKSRRERIVPRSRNRALIRGPKKKKKKEKISSARRVNIASLGLESVSKWLLRLEKWRFQIVAKRNVEKKEKRGETVVKSGSGRNTYIYISNETNERDRERKRERKIGNRTDLDRNHFIFARDDDASATRPRETRTMIRGEAGTKGGGSI